jgi:predicted transcriptional regulator
MMPTAEMETVFDTQAHTPALSKVPAPVENRNPMRGIKAELGTLERPIMDIIWSMEAPSEVGDVVESLRNHPDPTRRRIVAYTTVMTTMTRMAQKGYLRQDRAAVPYKYSPAITRDEFRVAKIAKTINELRQVDPEGVTLALMGMIETAAGANQAPKTSD